MAILEAIKKSYPNLVEIALAGEELPQELKNATVLRQGHQWFVPHDYEVENAGFTPARFYHGKRNFDLIMFYVLEEPIQSEKLKAFLTQVGMDMRKEPEAGRQRIYFVAATPELAEEFKR